MTIDTDIAEPATYSSLCHRELPEPIEAAGVLRGSRVSWESSSLVRCFGNALANPRLLRKRPYLSSTCWWPDPYEKVPG